MLDSRPKGGGFEPHRHPYVVSLSKNINPSLVLAQPRKTSPFITEILLMGCKESNQTNMLMGCIFHFYSKPIFHFYSNLNRIFCKHTVETLIRRRILRHLIWICTVCLCPTKRTLGLYGLRGTLPVKIL